MTWKKLDDSREFWNAATSVAMRLVDERAIEPRRLAVRQQVGHEIQLGVARREHRRRVPREVDARQLDAILEQQARSPVSAAGVPHAGARPRARRNVAEVPFRQREGRVSGSMSPAIASDALPGW